MRLALLWTDKFFLGILVIGFLLILNALRRASMRRAYAHIMRQPIAVSAGMIVVFFLLIGVLDSVRFESKQTNNASVTLLDWIVAPLGTMHEATYSKPLALSMYTADTVWHNGKATPVYARLKYPPSTIQTEKQKWLSIRFMFLKSIGSSFGLIALITLVSRRAVFWYSSAGRAALLTLFICTTVLLVSFFISRDFHLFGTGKIGQDIFYYAIKSIRTGLIIGVLTTVLMLPLALFLGISAGYFGGVIDDIIQYTYTTLSSIPGVLLITASVLSMQTYIANHPARFPSLAASADARLFALCFILGVTSWTSLCRLLRAETLKLREIDYVLAARTLGSGVFTIILKHIVPNVMHIVLITLVLDFSYLVLAESVLSYVGVGVSPLTISWGNMINAARLELARQPLVWWPIASAFGLMFTLVLAGNLVADAVRDAFDPHRGGALNG